MARHTNYLSVRKVLLFSHTLLALSAALPTQEQFQHDVVTEIGTLKQHMEAQQQQMTTMQWEMEIQKQQLMEKMTAQQQHISGQQQQITALQQQVNSQKQELTEQTRAMAEDKQKIAGQQQQLVVQQQHIMALQQQMESQKHQLTEQTRQLAEEKEQLMGQQQQIATQQHITALQQQMKTQKHLLTEQTQHVAEQLTAQQQQIIALQTTTPVDKQMTRRLLEDDIVTDVDTLKQQMAAVRATQQKQGLLVASNAHLMHDLSPGPNQNIIYDDVSMNHGNAYSTVHGTFTAPYPGIYVFSISACSIHGHYIYLDLMQNAIAVKSILAGDNVYGACTSGTTMLDLHTGDTVWVRHHRSDGDSITAYYPRAVSFTGFLLHAS